MLDNNCVLLWVLQCNAWPRQRPFLMNISEGPTYFTPITMTEDAGFCDGTELDILTRKAFVVDISCILSFAYSSMIFHVTIQHQNRVASHCRTFVGYTME